MLLKLNIVILCVACIITRNVKCTTPLDLMYPSLTLTSPGDLEYSDVIVKRVGDPLQLTCQYRHDSKQKQFVWNFLPADSSGNRPLEALPSDLTYRSNVTIAKVKLNDTGSYICSFPPHSVKKYILVQPRVTNCAKGGLSCGPHCVMATFLCDGRKDCLLGEDEAPAICGTDNPCKGEFRVNCTSGRCIPGAACCVGRGSKCTPHPCCARDYFDSYNSDVDYTSMLEDRHATEDYGFIQSTIYTVTACALIFMVAVVVLVSAVCRMHMKRAALRTYSRPRGNHYGYSQAPRFPPCYELQYATRLVTDLTPTAATAAAAAAPPSNNQCEENDTDPEVPAPPAMVPAAGITRLGNIFSARYSQVPTQPDVEMTDVRSISLQNSPLRSPNPQTRSPSFCNFNTGVYFPSSESGLCGPDLNRTPGSSCRSNRCRQLSRYFDFNAPPRPITLQLGRFQLNIPRFSMRRSATELNESDRRPDTPNVAELSIDDIDFLRMSPPHQTYSLNGRTIRLLGANFDNYPTILGPNGLAPPPYNEVMTNLKLFGPPPEYLSRDNLNNIRQSGGDVNGNTQGAPGPAAAESQTNIELPPDYNDLGNINNNNGNENSQ